MEKKDFLKIVDKYLEGSATEEETLLLFNYYNSFQQSEEWNKEELGNSEEVAIKMLGDLNTIISKEKEPVIVPFYHQTWFKLSVAALLVLIAGRIFWWTPKENVGKELSAVDAEIFTPKTVTATKATLVLANGKTIMLDSVSNGIIANEGKVSVRKKDAQLNYEISTNKSGGPKENDVIPAYHTLYIPKGSQYQLVLSDGSKVWLNASSTLRLPASFSGKERQVDLSGEAYFEVAKDTKKPFRVYAATPSGKEAKGAWVEVLGTHFNINAYEDEHLLKATLLEGSVKVTPVHDAQPESNNACILLPGQQAQISASSLKENKALNVQAVDMEEAVAWKNNLFLFKNSDIKTIMRQLARWYDVSVVYEGNIPERNFSGKINRNTELTTVLKILEQSNIRFRIEGKRIVVRS